VVSKNAAFNTDFSKPIRKLQNISPRKWLAKNGNEQLNEQCVFNWNSLCGGCYLENRLGSWIVKAGLINFSIWIWLCACRHCQHFRQEPSIFLIQVLRKNRRWARGIHFVAEVPLIGGLKVADIFCCIFAPGDWTGNVGNLMMQQMHTYLIMSKRMFHVPEKGLCICKDENALVLH
jgi:hypothetical protein